MSFHFKYHNALEIQLKHHYYINLDTDGNLVPGDCRDFRLEPSPDTKQMLHSAGYRCRKKETGIVLQKILDPTSTDINNRGSTKSEDFQPLYFEMLPQNPLFYYYTDIDWFTFGSREIQHVSTVLQNKTVRRVFYFSFDKNMIISEGLLSHDVGPNDQIYSVGKALDLMLPDRTKEICFISKNGKCHHTLINAQGQSGLQRIDKSKLPDGVYKVQCGEGAGRKRKECPDLKNDQYLYSSKNFLALAGVIEVAMEDLANVQKIELVFPARKSYWQYYITHQKDLGLEIDVSDPEDLEGQIYPDNIQFEKLDDSDSCWEEYRKRSKALIGRNYLLHDYDFTVFRSHDPIPMHNYTRTGISVKQTETIPVKIFVKNVTNPKTSSLRSFENNGIKKYIIERQLQITKTT